MNTRSTEGVVACSFCGKNQNEVAQIISGPQVNICDLCVDLCNDIIEEQTLMPDESLFAFTEKAGGDEYLIRPQIVTRYTKEKITVVPPSDLLGTYWVCEGCGWRLKLPPGAKPPGEHSEEIVLGLWPGPAGKLPLRELVPNCPNPFWRKVFEPVPSDES